MDGGTANSAVRFQEGVGLSSPTTKMHGWKAVPPAGE